MVLGIVGKIGSGKSAVVKYLQKNYDTIVFSCDDVAKEIMAKGETDYEPGLPGEIFTNEKKQEECRTILHPLVFERINENITNFYIKSKENQKENIKNKNNFTNFMNFSEKLIIIESALPSDIMFKMCDKVIYIDSPYEERVKRLKDARDYSESKTKLIYDSQKYYEKFYDMADFKINNDGTKEELEKKIKEVMDEIYITCK